LGKEGRRGGTRELSELEESPEWEKRRGRKMDSLVKPEDDAVGVEE